MNALRRLMLKMFNDQKNFKESFSFESKSSIISATENGSNSENCKVIEVLSLYSQALCKRTVTLKRIL